MMFTTSTGTTRRGQRFMAANLSGTASLLSIAISQHESGEHEKDNDGRTAIYQRIERSAEKRPRLCGRDQPVQGRREGKHAVVDQDDAGCDAANSLQFDQLFMAVRYADAGAITEEHCA